MTKRNVNGDAARSDFRRAQKLAGEKGLTAEEMDTIAAGVREFDEQRTTENRTAGALERIASVLTSQHRGGDGSTHSWEFEERRLRRREVYAQELTAVAMVSDDVADPNLEAIRQSERFRALVTRLTTARSGDDHVAS